ncbi:HAD family phosphatase [Erysipelotrichaceae bacterium RD49]|nr:HAD family phosphatase [Erysipelotrichaceae bacterium RD49]
MKSLICLDLDQTLWWDEKIPASALIAIKLAVQNGHLVFANTGRSRSSAWPSLEGLPFSGQIYSAGTEIWLEGQRIFFQPIGENRLRRIIDHFQGTDVGVCIEGSQKTFSNQKCRDLFAKVEQRKKGQKFFYSSVPDLSEMSAEDYGDGMKISLVDILPGSIDDLLEREGMAFTAFPFQDEDELINGEMTQKAYDKGRAFQIIEEILGQQYRTIAFGDSENDLSMFRHADIAVAMGNGAPAAKEAADLVTDSVLDNGLFHAFIKLGLLDENVRLEDYFDEPILSGLVN